MSRLAGLFKKAPKPVIEFTPPAGEPVHKSMPGQTGTRPEAFVPDPVKPPTTWAEAPGEGDPVWYLGVRWWVCNSLGFQRSAFVQICSDHYRPGGGVPKTATVLSVHADLLTPAPTTRHAFQKTLRTEDVARKETIKKKGDVDDEVAQLVRGKPVAELYRIAAKYLNEDYECLQKRFGHMNPGQQSMQLRNRMRNKK